MDMDQQQMAEQRKKRVQRLKKMIVISIVIGIIVPWVACVVLGVIVARMDQDARQTREYEKSLLEKIEEQGRRLEEMQNLLGDDRLREQEENENLRNRISELEEAVRNKAEQPTVEERKEEPSVHKVYLTFDDGPSIYTDEILDILKQYNVKATFFVLGKDGEDAKRAVKRIVDEGHSIGMHSYNHRYEEVYASKEAFAEDYQKIRDYLFQVAGVDCHLYRFPGGSSNAVSNVDVHVFIEYLKEQNTVYYDWNVASGDAAKVSLSAETILANATKGIESQPVSVILFHDAASRRTTVDALPMVIEKILAMENTVILPITAEDEPVQHVK